MNRITTLTIVAALAMTGCFQLHTQTRTLDLSESYAAREAAVYTISLTDGQQREVLNLQVRDDSTSWINPNTGDPKVVATAQIKTISHDMKGEGQQVTMRRTVPPSAFDASVVTESRPAGRDYQTLSRINELGARKIATVRLTDGRTLKASSLHVTRDSTSWFDARTDRFERVATAEVFKIRFGSRGRTFVGGAVGGAVGFAIAAAAIGKVERCEDLCEGYSCISCIGFTEEQKDAMIIGSIAMLAGGVLGTAVAGTVIEFRLVNRSIAPAPAPPVVTEDVKQRRQERK